MKSLYINKYPLHPDTLTLYEQNLVERTKGCKRPYFAIRATHRYVYIRIKRGISAYLVPSLQTMLIEGL